jgi:hypothetical protein
MQKIDLCGEWKLYLERRQLPNDINFSVDSKLSAQVPGFILSAIK